MKTEILAWLINATIATSIAGIAILLLRKPLQRWLGAEIAYRLWIALPLASFAAFFSLPHPTPVASNAAQQAFTTAPAVIVRVTSSLGSIDADRWLLAIWLGGACALFAVLVWRQRRFVALLRLRSHGDGSWRSGVENATPAVLGVLRQKLVLPECFETDFSHDEQHLVIAHERMHQQRRDPWALAACALLRTVFWFNPIVHVAATHFRRDVELACDAAVLRAHPGSRRRYADALLKTQMVDHALPIGCHWHHTPPMKERIMLLKNALPARRARLAGAILVAIATLGATGIALAGHDAAISTASALAAAAPASHATPYMVKLTMSVDGKPAAHPAVVTRAGETAMIKIDENGITWGMRFHVDPEHDGRSARLTGDVFTNSEQHVIGHAQLGISLGTPGVIELSDKSKPGPIYRIEATATIAPSSQANRSMHAETYASANATAAPGERREIEIVRNGKPGPDDAADVDEQDTLMPGDTPTPGQRVEVRREITTPAPSGGKTVRVERRVVMTRNADGTAPPPPLPPLPPLPPTPPDATMQAPTPPPPPPMGMRPPPPPPGMMANGMTPPAPPAPMARMHSPHTPRPPMAPLPPPPPPQMASLAPLPPVPPVSSDVPTPPAPTAPPSN